MIEENTGRRGNVKMNYAVDGYVVKFLGRTCSYKGIRWCGLSGSGIAFKVTGTYARIKIVGDDTTAGRVTEGCARIGIYLNGKRVIDRVVTQPEEVITVFDGEKTQSAEVMVIKLSECAMSTVGIAEIQTDGKPDPLPDKKRKIEFIGDSITCGYGVDLEDPETAFRTDTEDVTRAYAYKRRRHWMRITVWYRTVDTAYSAAIPNRVSQIKRNGYRLTMKRSAFPMQNRWENWNFRTFHGILARFVRILSL